MHVHKGYKIFNLRSNTVTKIFDPDVDKAGILSEIEQLKKVSQIEFAPSLRQWDIDGRWYQEEYIRSSIAASHRSADSVVLLKAFCEEALPCMKSLILFQLPQTKNLSVYLKEIMGVLERSEFSQQKLDLKEAEVFNKFVHATVELLNAEGDAAVHLVPSHGDFCPANLLNTEDGLKIIDWESIGYRSLLFDFYSYFFYRPLSPGFPVDKIVLEINEALPVFISKLSSRAPELTKNLPGLLKIYRRLYYIERICMLVERDLTDNNLNMADFIARYIRAFSKYENILTGDAVAVKDNNCHGANTCQAR